jgi:uncharacterized tellurite resistance protein B-like protein
MTHNLFSTIKAFFRGEASETPVSLLVDRHGNLLSKELAAVFTALMVEMSLSDQSLQEKEVHEIVSILQSELALSEKAAEDVFSATLEGRGQPEHIVPKLSLIALTLNDDQKEHLLRLALAVARADDHITDGENIILDNLCKQLHISDELAQTIRARG